MDKVIACNLMQNFCKMNVLIISTLGANCTNCTFCTKCIKKRPYVRILILLLFINIYILLWQLCNLCNLALFDTVKALFYYI